MASNSLYAIVAGVGTGTGRSVALRFAKVYPVVLLARKPENYNDFVSEINKAGGKAVGISTDVTDQQSVTSAFDTIQKEMSGQRLAAAVYNVGGGFVRKPFLELTLEEYQSGLAANGTGLYNFAQKALPQLLKAVDKSSHPPTLIVTGATASVRGSAQTGSFASGKFAQRALTQSLAREFGPRGVHVALAIIDGVIDIPRTKAWDPNPGKPDGKISPDAIADTYWHLHEQHRSAFTQEVDMRSWVEKF